MSYATKSCVKPLCLTNDGKLELFFLGVGSAFASQHRQTNFLIIKGDTHIMVDFGMTGPEALRSNAGLEPTDIKTVLPTHSHADHVGGIECLALMNRYVGQRQGKPKLIMITPGEYARILWDETLRGGLARNEEISRTHTTLTLGDYFDTVTPRWKTHQPREIFHINFGGINLELFRTNHMPEQAAGWQASFVSYGLLIDARVLVSGDTQFDPELIKFYGPGAEVIFHDVQFFTGGVHASLEELKTLPAELEAKTLLMHYPDQWASQDISGFRGWAEEGVRYIFN
ncbi:MAG: MBL fold metallo-hydrolase [Candidatus Nealsonbacteria bacterium]|nr:MBL fold metallo-hydrolase [Candidatus Nealsonbacteria bacterium]